eukprot:4132598-Pleurochrysis_carterae.AAC.2
MASMPLPGACAWHASPFDPKRVRKDTGTEAQCIIHSTVPTECFGIRRRCARGMAARGPAGRPGGPGAAGVQLEHLTRSFAAYILTCYTPGAVSAS